MTEYREAAGKIVAGAAKRLAMKKPEAESGLIDEYEISTPMGPFLWVRIEDGCWEMMTRTDTDGRPRATMGDLVGNRLGDLQAAVSNMCRVADRVSSQCRAARREAGE